MIYLKFMVKKEDGSATKTVCTNSYETVMDDGGTRVYFEPCTWERLSPSDWLNCFVMSETGKTIDKLEVPYEQ